MDLPARLARIAVLLLPGLFAPLPAKAVDLTVEGARVIMSGSLYGNLDVDKFARLLAANPAVKTVVMKNFYGGIGMDSFFAVTELIRERGLNTEVDGPCISACALAFIGGARRRLAPEAKADNSYVAFHGVYFGGGRHAREWRETVVTSIQRYTGMPAAFAGRMFDLPQAGFVAFFDPAKLKRADGHSVMLCKGEESSRAKDCSWIKGVSGTAYGVFR